MAERRRARADVIKSYVRKPRRRRRSVRPQTGTAASTASAGHPSKGLNPGDVKDSRRARRQKKVERDYRRRPRSGSNQGANRRWWT